MFFVLVPFLKRAPRIIIHLARNVEKGGGVLMRITLPNLKHSFICPVPVPVPVPDPVPDPVSDFLVFHTPENVEVNPIYEYFLLFYRRINMAVLNCIRIKSSHIPFAFTTGNLIGV